MEWVSRVIESIRQMTDCCEDRELMLAVGIYEFDRLLIQYAKKALEYTMSAPPSVPSKCLPSFLLHTMSKSISYYEVNFDYV